MPGRWQRLAQAGLFRDDRHGGLAERTARNLVHQFQQCAEQERWLERYPRREHRRRRKGPEGLERRAWEGPSIRLAPAADPRAIGGMSDEDA